MNDAEQEFELWAGVSGAELGTVIVSVVALAYLLWLAWLAVAQWRSWSDGEVSFLDMTWIVIRATVVVVAILWILQ